MTVRETVRTVYGTMGLRGFFRGVSAVLLMAGELGAQEGDAC
jgi:hypothetical protein